MIDDDEHLRERLLTRLRKHFTARRAPRATMSVILFITGLAGFTASVVMLRFGLGQMGVRYPLAVLVAWGFFLALVRVWAAQEADHFPVEEHLADPTLPEAISHLPEPGAKKRRDHDGSWLDWLDLGDLFGGEPEGCLIGLGVVLLIALFAGALVTVASLIGQAEFVIAELFLDAVLLSAFTRRLRRLTPRWWVAGVLRQTMWPVLLTAASLMAGGFLLQNLVPEARSIGGVWRHYHPAPPASAP